MTLTLVTPIRVRRKTTCIVCGHLGHGGHYGFPNPCPKCPDGICPAGQKATELDLDW
jgi:hypothetical protein